MAGQIRRKRIADEIETIKAAKAEENKELTGRYGIQYHPSLDCETGRAAEQSEHGPTEPKHIIRGSRAAHQNERTRRGVPNYRR